MKEIERWPSCKPVTVLPLHLGTLDSPDYWTDDALMAAVRPLSATELHRMTWACSIAKSVVISLIQRNAEFTNLRLSSVRVTPTSVNQNSVSTIT